MTILIGLYQQQQAHRSVGDLAADVKVVTRIYQRLREALHHMAELEGGKLAGEIELDESYFGGHRKGLRGRGAAGKSIVFGLLERMALKVSGAMRNIFWMTAVVCQSTISRCI